MAVGRENDELPVIYSNTNGSHLGFLEMLKGELSSPSGFSKEQP
jgi:hypothetical protein